MILLLEVMSLPDAIQKPKNFSEAEMVARLTESAINSLEVLEFKSPSHQCFTAAANVFM